MLCGANYVHSRKKKLDKLLWDNDKLSPILASVRHLQGRLLGRMESLGFDFIESATLESLICISPFFIGENPEMNLGLFGSFGG